MELHTDDDTFVRAPIGLVYKRLTDVGGWRNWWPKLDVEPVTTSDDTEVVAITLRSRPWRRLRYRATLSGWRHDAGFSMRLDGDLTGRAEWWLERVEGGTVVHHVLAARPTRRPTVALRDYRAVLRAGLWTFKDNVEAEVRYIVGAEDVESPRLEIGQ